MLTVITMAVLAIGVPLGLAMSLVIHDLHDLLLYGSVATLVAVVGGIIAWVRIMAVMERDPAAELPWLHEAPSVAEPASAWARLSGEAEAAAARGAAERDAAERDAAGADVAKRGAAERGGAAAAGETAQA